MKRGWYVGFHTKKSVARRKKNGPCVFFLFCFSRCVCLEQRSYEYFLTSGKLRWKRSKGSSAPWLSLSRGSLERWLSPFISAQNRKHPSSPHDQCLANCLSLYTLLVEQVDEKTNCFLLVGLGEDTLIFLSFGADLNYHIAMIYIYICSLVVNIYREVF